MNNTEKLLKILDEKRNIRKEINDKGIPTGKVLRTYAPNIRQINQSEPIKPTTYGIDVTENGEYLPQENMYFDRVSVNVPEKEFITEDRAETYTENGEYTITKSDNVDGIKTAKININVPQPQPEPQPIIEEEKTIDITSNGGYDSTPSDGHDAVKITHINVNVPEREIVTETVERDYNENGSYIIEKTDGYDGIESARININVPTANIQPAIYKTITANGNIVINPTAGFDAVKQVYLTIQHNSSYEEGIIFYRANKGRWSDDDGIAHNGFDFHEYGVSHEGFIYKADNTYIDSIPNNAFKVDGDKVGFEFMKLPFNIYSIGDNAFDGQIYIKDLIFGDSLRQIGSNAFNQSGIRSLTFRGKQAPITSASTFNGMQRNGVVFIPQDATGYTPITSALTSIGWTVITL